MKVVSRRDTSKRYRCQKHTCGTEQESYDKSTIQKLVEIFDFDYPAMQKALDAKKTFEHCGSESTNSKYDCSQCDCDTRSDSFLYAPLETFKSPVYPLSLPPPRSDDDIQPVSSNKQQRESRLPQDSVSEIANIERRLLLHDLFSGDIYDS